MQAARAIPSESEVRMEAGDDLRFKPDILVRDGDIFRGPDWTIEAIATPGHTSNHFCFALKEENALFAGDHVMGWSTTVISPPDGHMGDYFAQPRKNPRPRLLNHLADAWPAGHQCHARSSTSTSLTATRANAPSSTVCEAGDTRIPEMVSVIYRDVDKRLHPAACHSVLAHIIHLVETGRVEADGPLGLATDYRLKVAA